VFRSITRKVNRNPLWYRYLADRADVKYINNSQRQPRDFNWRVGPRADCCRVEPGTVQIGHKLYVFGGYVTLGSVSQRVDVLDLQKQQWTETSLLPSGVPQTHAGIATDGHRFIFTVSGQLGANCSPGVKHCFSFDTQNHTWTTLPDLPEVRYMSLVHMSGNRLHCLGGTQGDRHSPSVDHWSLEIRNGRAIQDSWMQELPLPEARNHTASCLVGSKLFVLGGQQTDVPPIADDPNYTCNFATPMDDVFDNVFSFDLHSGDHKPLASMPIALSHSEHAARQIGQRLILCGGVRDRMTLSDVILSYDLDHNRWQQIGTLPYPMKSQAAAWHDGLLFIVNGQRSNSKVDLAPGPVLDTVWITELN
jgi:N-acetylneuraminic acid mutarotase